MTTSGTKTRALCVATRCTTVDQFVATFHRFCSDDESFFVATLTSRPIGLETPFSIQLADKQPVLRGLCIVLDAWATPENRYRRPGIRLGIKRLTADSQLVFDRLRQAARTLGIAEATPPPGPPPSLPAALASRSPLPPVGARLPTPPSPGHPPPPSSPVSPQQSPQLTSPGSLSLLAPAETTSPGPPPIPARPPAMPPPLPRVVTARRPLPAPPISVVPIATPPPLPSVPAVESSAPFAEPPRVSFAASSSAIEPLVREPSPRTMPRSIAVTRFQVALNVTGALPPIDDIVFQPQELPQRPRVEPRIGDPEPVIVDDSATPAVIVGELPAPADVFRTDETPTISARAPEERTPGSALVLPANPLHDLSDESLEGFVDCTLYEESGNFFHPTSDDVKIDDELADPPAAPLATRSARPGTVPAMPFDTAPNLTVLALGESESLRVSPDELPDLEGGQPPTVESSAPPPWPDAGMAYPSYPTIDPVHHASYAAMQQVEPQALPPEPLPWRPEPAWRRWAIIGGTAVAAIVVAFVIARLARGTPHAGSTQAAAGGLDASQAPQPTPSPRPSPSPPSQRSPSQPATVADDGRRAAAAISRSGAPPRGASAGDDEPGASGAAVIGSGPCRLTIATTPAGSMVRLDDAPVGPSPLTIASTCEKHKIELSHARYQAQTRWVTLAADKPQELDVNLPRPTHAVTVTSFPTGAELSIDGRRAGTTPTVVQMMGFSTMNLTFTKPGFQSVTRKVYSKLAQDHVFVKLMK
jgi:PEGA domain